MELTPEAVQAALHAVNEEQSDRAAVVLGVATLDALLERLLRAWLAPDTPDSLYHPSGALSTLSSKTDLAYSLGLISKQEWHDLRLLRKVRNDFAHDFDHTLSFATPSVCDRISALSTPHLLDDIGAFASGTPKQRFYQAIGVMSLALSDFRLRDLVPRQVPDDIGPAT